MLVHQWAESYRDYPEQYERAVALAGSNVFIDAGDYGEYPASPLSKGDLVPPPFHKVVLQVIADHAGTPVPYLIFTETFGGRVVADEGYVMMVSMRMPGANEWVTADPMRIFTQEDTEGVGHGFRLERSVKSQGVFNYEDSQYKANEDQKGEQYIVSVGANMAQAVFSMMACSNVRTRDHQPDAALNKKRAKAGKVPLVSYKTLEIIVPNTRYEGGGSGGGTHASPRVHLRRGHIRKIADGKTVWVQACVVGSKHGMVLKDYKLRSAA